MNDEYELFRIFATMIQELKEKYRRFREWQKQPHQVAPLSNVRHECATCGTLYEGNYCPRCGQSAKVGRYSFKQAFLLFLDVWGLGNRGMFRSIRDLILRPGYMIRDYLQGMQMAYFPPFKMFFLLFALSLLVDSGLNIRLENRMATAEKEFGKGVNDAMDKGDGKTATMESTASGTNTQEVTAKAEAKSAEAKKSEVMSKEFETKINAFMNRVSDWCSNNASIVTILLLLMLSGPLYLFFRKSAAYPGIRFSEFFVAMVYSMNMIEIFSIISSFLCLSVKFELSFILLAIFPIKQLTGYSYWTTLLKFVLALILFAIIFVLAIILVILAAAFIIKWMA